MQVVATFPGPVTELLYYLREPKWEDFHQVGGRGSVALRKRLRQTLKYAAIIWTLLTIRKKGWKRFRTDLLLWVLMRYQDIMGLTQGVRSRALALTGRA